MQSDPSGIKRAPADVSRAQSQGVIEVDMNLNRNRMYMSSFEIERDGLTTVEDLGLYSIPELAAVARDVFACKVAFDSGDVFLTRPLDLNYYLGNYNWQFDFLSSLKSRSAGELAVLIKSSGLAEKLFQGTSSHSASLSTNAAFTQPHKLPPKQRHNDRPDMPSIADNTQISPELSNQVRTTQSAPVPSQPNVQPQIWGHQSASQRGRSQHGSQQQRHQQRQQQQQQQQRGLEQELTDAHEVERSLKRQKVSAPMAQARPKAATGKSQSQDPSGAGPRQRSYARHFAGGILGEQASSEDQPAPQKQLGAQGQRLDAAPLHAMRQKDQPSLGSTGPPISRLASATMSEAHARDFGGEQATQSVSQIPACSLSTPKFVGQVSSPRARPPLVQPPADVPLFDDSSEDEESPHGRKAENGQWQGFCSTGGSPVHAAAKAASIQSDANVDGGKGKTRIPSSPADRMRVMKRPSDSSVALKEDPEIGGHTAGTSGLSRAASRARESAKGGWTQAGSTLAGVDGVDEQGAPHLSSTDKGAEPRRASDLEAVKGESPSDAPFNVWLQPDPEWPQGSGKFPIYVKQTQLRQKWFTLTGQVVQRCLPDAEDGTFLLEDDEGHVTEASFWLKPAKDGAKESGTAATSAPTKALDALRNKQSCYIRRLTQFIHSKDLKEGDVVWLKRADAPNKALCGVWKAGSQEAREFTAQLKNSQTQRQSRVRSIR